MTVIAAVARDGAVVMAADTASHDGMTRFASGPKIRRYGDVLLAAAGYAALGPALRSIELPACDDLNEWAQQVAERITDALAARTPPLVTNPAGEDIGGIPGELLLGHAGRLWYIDSNLALPCDLGVGVIGSGADCAYGAVHTALNLGAKPATAVRNAVEMACQRNAGCALIGGVLQIEHLDAE